MAGQWVSTGEAAEVLDVSRRELYRLIDEGEVPARRCGPTLEVFPWGHRRRLRVLSTPGHLMAWIGLGALLMVGVGCQSGDGGWSDDEFTAVYTACVDGFSNSRPLIPRSVTSPTCTCAVSDLSDSMSYADYTKDPEGDRALSITFACQDRYGIYENPSIFER